MNAETKLMELYIWYARKRYPNPQLERGNFIWCYGNVLIRLAAVARRLGLKELDRKLWDKAESYYKLSQKWFEKGR